MDGNGQRIEIRTCNGQDWEKSQRDIWIGRIGLCFWAHAWSGRWSEGRRHTTLAMETLRPLQVNVLLHLDPPLAHTVNVEPLTPADWESTIMIMIAAVRTDLVI